MAKRQNKNKRKTRSDAVRAAVDDAFQAAAGQAQFTRERAQELADELAQAATRVRETLEELRPPSADDVRTLRAQVSALEKRVAALEKGGTRRTTAAARKPATRRTTARKPAAKPAAKG